MIGLGATPSLREDGRDQSGGRGMTQGHLASLEGGIHVEVEAGRPFSCGAGDGKREPATALLVKTVGVASLKVEALGLG